MTFILEGQPHKQGLSQWKEGTPFGLSLDSRYLKKCHCRWWSFHEHAVQVVFRTACAEEAVKRMVQAGCPAGCPMLKIEGDSSDASLVSLNDLPKNLSNLSWDVFLSAGAGWGCVCGWVKAWYCIYPTFEFHTTITSRWASSSSNHL